MVLLGGDHAEDAGMGNRVGCVAGIILEALGYKAQRHWVSCTSRACTDAQSAGAVQPNAAVLAPGDYDRMHNFTHSGYWDTGPLKLTLAHKVDQPGRQAGCDPSHQQYRSTEEGRTFRGGVISRHAGIVVSQNANH